MNYSARKKEFSVFGKETPKNVRKIEFICLSSKA